jgi:hypothetical protein
MARNLIPLMQGSGNMRFVLTILIYLFTNPVASGQKDTMTHKNDTLAGRIYLLQKVNRNGEVLPEVNIKEVTVLGQRNTAKKSWYRKYDRLVYNLKIVYPYALIVRARIYEVNEALTGISGDKERRRYMKDVEKDVFREYEDDMRELTLTQGRLLIKLIDRETQNTSYELIKQYRGGLTAAFWQGVARIFGTNLKDDYDPYGTDVVIELILQDIETGRL